jgi:hypothetical protein
MKPTNSQKTRVPHIKSRRRRDLKDIEVVSADCTSLPLSNGTNMVQYFVKVPKFATASMLKKFHWQSLVFYSLLRSKTLNEQKNGRFINFPSKFLKKQFGKNYKKHIHALIDLNPKWVEVNDSYSNGDTPFCKSYRISDYNYPFIHEDHSILIPSVVLPKFLEKSGDTPTKHDADYLRLIKERHDTLTMKKRLQTKDGREMKSILDRRTPRITIGENLRVYSPIIMKDADLRKHILFGDAGRLVNVDVSGMIQQLLNREIKDKKWDQWIKDGFADALKKKLGFKVKSDLVKEMFMVAVSKGEYSAKVISMQKFLRKEFPKIMEYVDKLNDVDSVQLRTQQMEANLIRAFIMENKTLTVIPAHDGVFCGEKDAWKVKAALEEFLQGRGLVGHTKIKCYSKKSRDFIQQTQPQKPLTLLELFS